MSFVSRRRRRGMETPAVQLFPFLAVLICTFGVLIVLLVLVVKRADVKANRIQAEVKENSEMELNDFKTKRDLLFFQNQAFEVNRSELRQQVQDARQRRSYLIESLRELEEKRRLAAIEYAQLQARQTTPSLGKELSLAADEIEKLESDLVLARSKQSVQQPTTYSIVPYRGSVGTHRRPIYLECRNDGIFFQPAGIRLTKKDFLPGLQAGNPLDEAFLAVRDYWNRNDLAGKEGDPYPLIVVRPGGVKNYSIVRHAMKSWDDEFGYELVAEDLDIDFGSQDAMMDREIQIAIDRARRQQQALQIAQHQRRTSGSQGFRVSNSLGGFVDNLGRPAQIQGNSGNGQTDPTRSLNGSTEAERVQSNSEANRKSNRFGPRAQFDQRGAEGSVDSSRQKNLNQRRGTQRPQINRLPGIRQGTEIRSVDR